MDFRTPEMKEASERRMFDLVDKYQGSVHLLDLTTKIYDHQRVQRNSALCCASSRADAVVVFFVL